MRAVERRKTMLKGYKLNISLMKIKKIVLFKSNINHSTCLWRRVQADKNITKVNDIAHRYSLNTLVKYL